MWYYCLVETNTMDKEAILYSWNQVNFSVSCPSTDITVVIPIIIRINKLLPNPID